MDAITIQYIAVAFIFVLAIAFLVKRTRRSLQSKGGCSKGCGCDFSEPGMKKTKKAIY